MNNIIDKYKLILSIDFDGTICELAYPEIGCLRQDAVKYINKLYDEGYGIIINTCRAGEHEKAVIKFLKDNNIKYHLINENFQHLIDLYGFDTRKISADVYIDDKCLFDIPTWKEKYKIITKKYQKKMLKLLMKNEEL